MSLLDPNLHLSFQFLLLTTQLILTLFSSLLPFHWSLYILWIHQFPAVFTFLPSIYIPRGIISFWCSINTYWRNESLILLSPSALISNQSLSPVVYFFPYPLPLSNQHFLARLLIKFSNLLCTLMTEVTFLTKLLTTPFYLKSFNHVPLLWWRTKSTTWSKRCCMSWSSPNSPIQSATTLVFALRPPATSVSFRLF